MEAQMRCMTDLVKFRAKEKYKWKYVINLCGKELPLMTNREMVKRLIRTTKWIFFHKGAESHSTRVQHSNEGEYDELYSQTLTVAPSSFNVIIQCNIS